MTPTEQRLFNRLRRLTAKLEPNLARAIMDDFERIASSMSEVDLASAIESGAIEDLFAPNGPLSREYIDASFLDLKTEMRAGIQKSAELHAADIPGARPGLAFGFDILNPKIIEALTALESRAISSLADGIRETVRQHVRAGIESGVHPRTIAKGLRDVIPLSPTQGQWVRNYRAELEAKDKAALDRKLRDKRYDKRTVNGMTKEQVDTATDAYRRKLVAHNAETNARTIALDANKLGHRLSWEDAIKRGIVEVDTLMMRWVTSHDDRVRPEHVALDGEEVGFTGHFSNGEQIPGSSTYNCRCVPIYFVRRAT